MARQKRPELLKFRHDLGETLEAAGRLREAERQFIAAANLRPDDPVVWLELMRFHSRVNNRTAALEACDHLRSLDESNEDYRAYCQALDQEAR